MNALAKFFRDCFTEDQAGQVFSLAHVISASGFGVFAFTAVYHVVATHQFDPQAMGMGLAGVMGGSGALIFANSKSGVRYDEHH